MNRRAHFAALLCFSAMAACSKGPVNTVVAASSKGASDAPSAKLAQVFTADMLGANLAYLETITGPAFKTDGDNRTYKVDGCTVIVGSSKGKVDNLGIDGYGGRCSFDIAQYFAGGYDHPVPPQPTFGDVKIGLGGAYAADCYRLCGNAAAPVVSLSYEGSHADNFNDLIASVPVVADPVLNAYTAWGDALVGKYGEDAVDRNAVPDTLDAFAAKAFAPLRPTTIRVGQNLIALPG
jgi:hypothetical protein